jgi:glycerol-3-phosphate dehydrogenase (NAD(P)+)
MSDTPIPPIAVLGAGSWGTALAIQLARVGGDVRLWGHEPGHMAALRADRRNDQFLPNGPTFPPNLHPTADLDEALADVDDLLLVVPSHAFKQVLQTVSDRGGKPRRIAWATKGLEPESGRLLHEVAGEITGEKTPLAVLSGPSFAAEVANDLPTAVTVAGNDQGFVDDFSRRIHGGNFRVYRSDDMAGVELGGAAKNVLAVAAGIADGLGFGANTRAALITRGLAEIMRLGEAVGGKRETLMGLSGLGDLILTCTDNQSRNRRFGLALGRGATQAEALASIGQVVEGKLAADEVVKRAAELGIDMPIAQQTYRVLYEDLPPKAAVEALLGRDPKAE